MQMDAVRDRHAAGIGERLDAGGQIDAVAEKVAVFDHNVPEVDPDAKHDRPVARHILVGGVHRALQRDGAFHGVDGAAELHKHAVACPLEHTALMALDERLQNLSPPRRQRRVRGRLVALHEPAVADHVGGQDRRESAPNLLSGHMAGAFREMLPTRFYRRPTMKSIRHARLRIPRNQGSGVDAAFSAEPNRLTSDSSSALPVRRRRPPAA